MGEILEIKELVEAYLQELPPLSEPVVLEGSVVKYIDHTLLKPEATPAQIEVLCLEAIKYQFASVCTNPLFVTMVAQKLNGSGVKTCVVAGFPLGAVPTAVKVAETLMYIQLGAEEVDMVLPIGLLKSGLYEQVFEDIRQVAAAAHAGKALLKVIIETSLLDRREKIAACLLAKEAGANFIKTSTGFSSRGATIEDVGLMRRIVGPVEQMGVKASGGVRSLADARAMLQVGANRLGSSSGVKIAIEELQEAK